MSVEYCLTRPNWAKPLKKVFPGNFELAIIPTELEVVAGLIADGNGLWLMQRRPLAKHHGGLWEFPGGKVEHGETQQEALVRELEEELAIRAEQTGMKIAARAAEPPSGAAQGVVITLYTVLAWTGQPRPEPGAELEWFHRDDIHGLAMPPLDAALLQALRMPPMGDCQG